MSAYQTDCQHTKLTLKLKIILRFYKWKVLWKCPCFISLELRSQNTMTHSRCLMGEWYTSLEERVLHHDVFPEWFNNNTIQEKPSGGRTIGVISLYSISNTIYTIFISSAIWTICTVYTICIYCSICTIRYSFRYLWLDQITQ